MYTLLILALVVAAGLILRHYDNSEQKTKELMNEIEREIIALKHKEREASVNDYENSLRSCFNEEHHGRNIRR